jgi:hypothetical protein
MTKKLAIAVATLLVAAHDASAAPGDCMNVDPPGWKTTPGQQALYDRLVQYMSCPSDDVASGLLADKVACNYFVGKALSDVYGITDFSTGSGTWLLANQILKYVQTHPATWSKLGNANSQAVLDDAAQGATNGQAVIAVAAGTPGHVALILPGTPKASGGWGLRAPNSAAFSLGHVENAYVFCRLSFAFSDPAKVEIYWRAK